MLSYVIWDDFPRRVNISVLKLLTHEAFKALFMDSNSAIFKVTLKLQ